MIIRRLLKNDLGKLAGLYEQFWNETSDISEMGRQFDLMDKENTHILLVAEDDGSLLGAVMGIICRELYGDCRPFLVVENMIVDQERRRQGIGYALLTELERLAKQRDCTQMILVTEVERKDACGFYENYGFALQNKGFKKKI
jgi:GNAT superfamily N-acetyltransferase